MRNKGRITPFMGKVFNLIKENCPKAIFTDILKEFLTDTEYGISDPFFLEEEQFLDVFKRFLEHRQDIVSSTQNNEMESQLQELGTLWAENVPDWRFGQLLFNVISASGGFCLDDEKFFNSFKLYFS